MLLHSIDYQDGQIWIDKTISIRNIKTEEFCWEEGLDVHSDVKPLHKTRSSSFVWKVVAQSPNLSLEGIPYIEIEEDVNPAHISCGTIDSSYKADKKWSDDDLRFHATRFAHLCRLKGVITNNDTVMLFDNEYIQSLQPKVVSVEVDTEYEEINNMTDYIFKSITYIKDGKTFLTIKKVNYE